MKITRTVRGDTRTAVREAVDDYAAGLGFEFNDQRFRKSFMDFVCAQLKTQLEAKPEMPLAECRQWLSDQLTEAQLEKWTLRYELHVAAQQGGELHAPSVVKSTVLDAGKLMPNKYPRKQRELEGVAKAALQRAIQASRPKTAASVRTAMVNAIKSSEVFKGLMSQEPDPARAIHFVEPRRGGGSLDMLAG